MKYYGNEPYIPGTHDDINPIQRTLAIGAYIPNGKKVITSAGDVYSSVSTAAMAAGVKQPTMSAWIRSGEVHQGVVWLFVVGCRVKQA